MARKNEVKITITSTDQSKAGVASATKGVKGLGDEAEKTSAKTEIMRGGFGVMAKSAAADVDKVQDKLKGLGDGVDAGRGGSGVSRFFDSFNKTADSAVAKLGEMLPAALKNPVVAGSLVAAGTFVGAAAGGAIVAGLGAGIAGAGIASAAGADRVKLAWSGLSRDLGREMRTISSPFQDTLIDIEGQARRSFGTFKPSLQKAFGTMSGDISAFSRNLFSSFDGSSIEPVQRAFSAILDDLGPRMPGVIDGISDSIVGLSESIERNPKALGQLIEGLGDLAEVGVDALTFFTEKVGLADKGMQLLDNWFHGKGYKLDIEVGSDFEGNIAGKMREIAGGFDQTGSSSYNAKSSIESYNAILLELANTELSVTDRGNVMVKLLDELAGRSPTYEDGMQGISDTIRDLGTMFDSTAEQANGFGAALINPDNTVSTMTANGSRLQDMMQGLQQDFANTAAGVRELEDAGLSHDDAVNKVNHDLNTQRDRLLAAAEGMGLTRAQMEGVLAAYALTPERIDTLVKLDDADATNRISWLVSDAYKNLYVRYFDPGAPRSNNAAVRGNGWGVGGEAAGGPVRGLHGAMGGGPRGTVTRINEHGGEIVDLPNGSMVIPHGMSESIRRGEAPGQLGGGWAPTLNLAGMPPAGTARQFIDWLTGELRKQGVKLVKT